LKLLNLHSCIILGCAAVVWSSRCVRSSAGKKSRALGTAPRQSMWATAQLLRLGAY
jgi:hypothetical protein